MHLRGGTEEFTINSIRRGIAAAGVVALITTGAAACGGDDEPSTARGKVTKAFTTLGEQKSVTIGLSFDTTAQKLYDAIKNSGDSEDFTLDDAKLLAGLHVKAGFSSDTPLGKLTADDKDGNSVLLEVTSGDGSGAKHLIGVRSVDKTLYVQADIKSIVALDQDNSDLAEVSGMLSSVDGLPDSFTSVKALAHGEWVSIDLDSFVEFFKSMGGSDGSDDSGDSASSALGLPSGLPTALPTDLTGKTVTELIAPLQKSLAKDAKLTDLGDKNGADHIKASIPARALTKDLKNSLESLGSLTKSLPADFEKSLDDVPNKTVNLDLALKNGELTAITLDMKQFDDTMDGSVPLVISIDGSAAQIDAPKGAKALDPQDLMGAAMQMFSEQSGGSDPFAS